MKRIKLPFDKSLYERKAIEEISDLFAGVCEISLSEDHEFFVINIEKIDPDADIGLIGGEVLNFVLARTIEHRVSGQ